MSKIDLPYTEDCFVCGEKNAGGLGLKFSYEDGEAIARYTPAADKCGYRDLVHGGILSTLLDETMGWAPSYEKRQMCVAAELKIRFVLPVRAGTPLVVRGRFTEDKRLFWKCTGTIEGEDGTVYVRGQGTFVPISPEETRRIEEETLLYPDGTPPIFSNDS